MNKQPSNRSLFVWQVSLLTVSMTWLLAPVLNHSLSYRLTLISQYETAGQPYAWLFRVGDLLAASLVLGLVAVYGRFIGSPLTRVLLLIVGAGMLIDPIFTDNCVVQAQVCIDKAGGLSVVHDIETVITALAFATLTGREAWRRRDIFSGGMAAVQVVAAALFASQFAQHHGYSTITQYTYQCLSLLWLAWFLRSRLAAPSEATVKWTVAVRWLVAAWAMANGFIALLGSLTAIHLLGHEQSLYFAGRTAWLAQHGVIVGVILFYLARHIIRGEQRARQVFLVIIGIEVLRYALITPSAVLLLFYGLTFALLFAVPESFQRGQTTLTWRARAKDLSYLLVALVLALIGVALFLLRNNHVTAVTNHALAHFGDYVFSFNPVKDQHVESALLAHTITAFIAALLAAILWILFRPARQLTAPATSVAAISQHLWHYSTSSEDYFKLWPTDKQYFWNRSHSTFIAYKIVGPIAFALADPIGPQADRTATVSAFTTWARRQGLRACYLPVTESSRQLYPGLRSLQVGASAVITTQMFIDTTLGNKWWRWKQNRARKQGYSYEVSHPPHAPELLQAWQTVSRDWLAHNNHQEYGFALGYFDRDYVQASVVHFLRDTTGTITTFVTQLPECKKQPTATIDLLRFAWNAQDTMPYLLANVITTLHQQGYTYFDLGFVPFAAGKTPLLTLAATLSAGRFSAKGLQQFKNKFNPDWQPCYIAYDGDLADLALIALNLEKAMRLQ